MSLRNALSLLSPSKPFLEGEIAGIQGVPTRHMYMIAAVGLLQSCNRPVKILEIGSWCGSSALSWAAALDKLLPSKGTLLCIDPWEAYFGEKDLKKGANYAQMTQIAQSDLAYNLFLHNIQFAPKTIPIDHFRGPANRILPYLADESFDLVYIDGSHYYKDASHDMEHAKRLVRDGGFICGDDLEMHLSEVDAAKTKKLTTEDYVQDLKTQRWFHPGVTLAVNEHFGEEVSVYEGFWIVQKNKKQYSKINLNGQTSFVPDHLSNIIMVHPVTSNQAQQKPVAV